MTNADAIAIVKQFGRNIAHRTDPEIQRAIDAAAREFCRQSKYLATLSSIAVAAAAESVDLPVTFRRDMFISASFTSDAKPQLLDVVEYETLVRMRATETARAYSRMVFPIGAIAFVTSAGSTRAEIWPAAPASGGTLDLRYGLPWSGQATDLPEDIFTQILIHGATSYLQLPDEEAPYVASARAEFRALILQYRGGGAGSGAASRTVMRRASR